MVPAERASVLDMTCGVASIGNKVWTVYSRNLSCCQQQCCSNQMRDSRTSIPVCNWLAGAVVHARRWTCMQSSRVQDNPFVQDLHMRTDPVLLCFNVAARHVALPSENSRTNSGPWFVTQDEVTMRQVLTMQPSRFVAASVVNFLMTLVCHDAVKASHLQTCDAETGLYPYTLPNSKATVAVMPSMFSQRMLDGTRLAKVCLSMPLVSTSEPPCIIMAPRAVNTWGGACLSKYVH